MSGSRGTDLEKNKCHFAVHHDLAMPKSLGRLVGEGEEGDFFLWQWLEASSTGPEGPRFSGSNTKMSSSQVSPSHSHPRGPWCQQKRYIETAHLFSFANLPRVEFIAWARVSVRSSLHLQSLLKWCRILTLLKQALSWQLDTKFNYLIFFFAKP